MQMTVVKWEWPQWTTPSVLILWAGTDSRPLNQHRWNVLNWLARLVQVSLLWGCAAADRVVSAEGAVWMPPQLPHILSARELLEGSQDRMQSLPSQSNKKLFLPREAGRHIKESSMEGYFFSCSFPPLTQHWRFFRTECSGCFLDEISF